MDYYQEFLLEEIEFFQIALDRGDLDKASEELFKKKLEYLKKKLEKIQFFQGSST